MHMDNGNGIFSHELTASEMNRLSLVLSIRVPRQSRKRIQVAAIVNSIALSGQVAQNYEQEWNNTMVKARTCKSDKRQNSEITNTSPIKDNNYDQMQCDNQRPRSAGRRRCGPTARDNRLSALPSRQPFPPSRVRASKWKSPYQWTEEKQMPPRMPWVQGWKLQGTLTFRKRSDNLYLNFHAEAVDFAPVSDKDSITGDIEFAAPSASRWRKRPTRKAASILYSRLSAPRKTEKPSLSLGCVSSVSRQSGRLSLHLRRV